MRWASAIATASHLGDAVAEGAEAITSELGATPDLVVAFVSQEHADHFGRFPQYLSEHLPGAAVVGCSAGGVIGAGLEVEGEPSLSLTAAVLPGVTATTFHLSPSADSWQLEDLENGEPELVVLPDPLSCDVQGLLSWLDGRFPASTKVGGLASGGGDLGDHALFTTEEVYRSGAVGVALSGNIEIDTIVAQGCRPIGQPMFITRAEHNIIVELDGQPAVLALEMLHSALSPDDQRLLRHGLHLGVVMQEQREIYEQGDFLIRDIVGIDPEANALAVNHIAKEGQVVQFHLRDATTSAEDLSEMLTHHQYAEPAGALLFSCLGRGKGLYGQANHDSTMFRKHMGPVPLGGFFGNGEIGPVQGTTFLHGYTSSFGLFRPKFRS